MVKSLSSRRDSVLWQKSDWKKAIVFRQCSLLKILRYQIRYCAVAATLSQIPCRARWNFFLSTWIQRKCRYLLSQQSMDFHCRNSRWTWWPCMAGIHQNLSCLYRRYQRNPPHWTICVLSDDCRKDAPNFGEAKNSWLTGTAAWTFLDVSQYILGIRPDYDGLVIDPCIPSTLSGFTANVISVV